MGYEERRCPKCITNCSQSGIGRPHRGGAQGGQAAAFGVGWGQPPGKRTVGIRVVNHAGESFGWSMMSIGAPLFGILCPLTFGTLFYMTYPWPPWEGTIRRSMLELSRVTSSVRRGADGLLCTVPGDEFLPGEGRI